MERAGDRCRVLFLADGYRHKNHQVLTAVCEELRKRGLDSRYRIFVTLDPARRENDALLERLSRTGGIVVNLGKLSPEHVQSALVSSDVLLNPSLAESFGFPFLEAMARRVPVVAADRDFARWMCGPCAAYCDALSASSIVNALEQACSRSRDREAFARDAAAQLAKFPGSWSDTAAEWAKLIREIVATR
jgi:glycosyltransferase involved in cell wall biosynthesis